MALAYVGRMVQTPASPLDNNGADRMSAVITDILGEQGEGPNGGTMVSLIAWPNSTDPAPYLPAAEFVEYDELARELGVGNGCWPTDSNE